MIAESHKNRLFAAQLMDINPGLLMSDRSFFSIELLAKVT